MSSKYINSRLVYQQEGIDYADDHYINGLLPTHLQNALLEIAALKAQVNCLRTALEVIQGETLNECRGLAIIAKAALELTPEQCLTEVKAKAVEEYKLQQAELKQLDLATKIMTTSV